MSAKDKVKNVAENAKGKVKQAHGKAVGDPALEAEGKAVQAKSDLKQAGEKTKDAVGTAVDPGAEAKGSRVKHDVKKAASKVKDAAKH